VLALPLPDLIFITSTTLLILYTLSSPSRYPKRPVPQTKTL
jgi:hypothetical protein